MIAALNFIIITTLSVFYFRNSGMENPRLYWISFTYKLAMSMVLGLVYLHYYSANDTWLFFKDATVLAEYASKSFTGYISFLFTDNPAAEVWSQLTNTQERSVFLIKVMSVFSLISGNNYWISAGYFALISFVAAWHLFKVVTKIYPDSIFSASLAFLFFPSVVFWSSGLVKETLALAGLYYISSVFLKIIYKQKVNYIEIVLSIICFLTAWNLKYYWAAIFGAVIFTTLIVDGLGNRFQFFISYKKLAWALVFLFFSVAISMLHPNFYLSRVLSVLVANHDEFIRISETHSVIHYYQLTDSWWSTLLNSPWALFSGLFRPFLWEANGSLAVLASLENSFILFLFLTSLKNLSKGHSDNILLITVLVYITLLCVFLALSTPNFGTLSRYRVGFLPFLIYIMAFRNPILIYLTNRISLLR